MEDRPSPFSIQPQIGQVFCSSCEVLFGNIRSAYRHLENNEHRKSREENAKLVKKIFSEAGEKQSTKMKELLKKYEAAPSGYLKDAKCDPLPVLRGVKVEQGYRCPECVYYAKHIQHLKDKHLQQHARNDAVKLDRLLSQSSINGTVPVQTLQLGGKTKYFPVFYTEENKVVANHPPDVVEKKEKRLLKVRQDFIKLLSEEIVHLKGSEEARNSRMLNEFVYRTRLDKVLRRAGISMEDAVFLSGRGTRKSLSNVETRLADLSKSYLTKYPDLIESLSPSILLNFSLRSDQPFRAVTGGTLETYSQMLGRFMISAYRHVQSKRLNEPPASLKSLISICECENFDKARAPPLFHLAVLDLCLVRRSEIEGVESLFVRLFLACNVVSQQGRTSSDTDFRYCRSHEVSPVAASLQYVITFTALVELWSTGERCIAHNRNPEQTKAASDAIEEELTLKIDVHKNTAAGYVRFILNICHHQRESYTTESRFMKCDSHRLCGFLKGVELSMGELGRFLRKWQAAAKNIIANDLLFGGEYSPMHESILYSLQDDMTEYRNGYSFMEHRFNREKIISVSADVLETILKSGKGSNQIFFDPKKFQDTDGNVVTMGEYYLRRKVVETWLGKCQQLQEILLVCLHISSGSPARATEISTYKLFNTELGPRNIYIVQNRLYLLCRYSKQRQMRGKDKPILRIPDRETSDLLKQYFVFFRKVEAKLVAALHGSKLECRHLQSAFVNAGEPYSAERIRQILKGKLKAEGKDMGISDYRNYSAAMVRLIARHSLRFATELVDEYASSGHEQAGHSMDTADRIYGRSFLDLRHLPADDFNRYKAWASDYQRALFEWENNENTEDPEPAVGSENRRKCDSDVDLECTGVPTAVRALIQKVTEVNENINVLMKKRPRDECGEQIGNELHSPEHKRMKQAFYDKAFQMLRPRRRDAATDALTLLPQLRKMMRNKDANFKSQMQADICGAMLNSEGNIFAIAGTGFGKTVCFLLPIFVEGPEFCSVVVVPLAALVDELLKKCETFGVTACTWRNRNLRDAQVVICAAEHVSSEEFKIFVRTLMIKDRLRWLILDEAHLAYYWEDFREKLQEMRYGLSCVPKRVKRALFTATAGPGDREKILEANGITTASLFLSDTLRKNLKICVREVKERVGERHGVPALTRELLRILREKKNIPGRIMVFAMSRTDVENIAHDLRSSLQTKGYQNILVYHGGMEEKNRKTTHIIWKTPQKHHEKSPLIIICTSAFGAGIDVADVREVYHIGGSSSLVQYAQEIGRAGRDGKKATCTVLYSSRYASSHRSLLCQKIGESDIFNQRSYEMRKLASWNEFTTWATDRKVCLKSSLYESTDGIERGICIYDSTSVNCEFCEETIGNSDSKNTLTEADKFESIGETPQSSLYETKVTLTREDERDDIAQEVKESRAACKPNGVSDVEAQRAQCSDEIENVVPRRPEEIWMKYENLSRRYQDLCISCLGRSRKEVKASEGVFCEDCDDEFDGSCYRCLSRSHKTNQCPLPRWVSGHCPNCGIRKFPSSPNIHPDGQFGKNCKWIALNKLFWVLWRSADSVRKSILNEVCGGDEASKLRKITKGGTSEAEESLKTLHTWLYNKKGTPNHARILFWVARQKN